jgi:hypothetical protein
MSAAFESNNRAHRRSRAGHRSRVRRGAVVAVAGLMPLWVAADVIGAATAKAESTANFEGLANAYGVDATIYNPSVPLGAAIQGAGPTAQAKLGSLDSSDAFASFPYPGDTFVGLPGTAGAIFGAPTPAYPLFVATQLGDRPADQDVPGVGLHAESGKSAAASRATVGDTASGFDSVARVEQLSDDNVRSFASAVGGVNLVNFVQLSGVQSRAEAVADAVTGKVTRSSYLAISRIVVPGLSVEIPKASPAAFALPIPIPGVGQLPVTDLPPIPFPSGGEMIAAPELGFVNGTFTYTPPAPSGKPTTYAIPAQLVLDAFKQAGVTVTYQAAQETPNGVIAPALTFAFQAPALPDNPGFNGPTDFAYAIGRATASVSLTPGTTDLGTTTPVGTTPTGTQGATASGIPGVDAAGLPSLGLPVAPADGASGVPADTTDQARQVIYAQPAAASHDNFAKDLSSIYVICLIVGVAAVVAVRVFA